jgi:UDP-2,3-diacylglucosamine pyrophosphatase LpxH
MRVAAISDFHIGASARADVFRHREDTFLAFLDRVEADHDRVVLLGDLFQTEHGWGVSRRAAADQLARAQARVPRLWRRLRGDTFVYIHGNHDAIAGSVCGARGDWRLEVDGFAVYFTHGHQFDPLLRRIYPAARTATWISGRLRSAGLRRLPDWLEHQDIVQKHRRFGHSDGPYARGARALMRRHRADAVVMGHTHVEQRLELPEGIFANTGSCSMGRLVWVSVDGRRRTVDVVRG